jgi:hypothetical protein
MKTPTLAGNQTAQNAMIEPKTNTNGTAFAMPKAAFPGWKDTGQPHDRADDRQRRAKEEGYQIAHLNAAVSLLTLG